MSEPEFEAFLQRLCRRLRLTTAERGAIAAELRDHLEERLTMLTSRGMSPAAAKQLALAEFGEETQLADNLAHPQTLKHRRRLMRYSIGSSFVIATTFVMASFYWPVNRPEPAHLAVAQLGGGTPAAAVAESDAEASRDALNAKLKQRTVALEFVDIPLREAIAFLSEAHQLPILLDQPALSDIGVDPEAPITLRLGEKVVSLKTALQLMLRMAGVGNDIAPTIRDGLVMVTTVQESYEVQVYNCRDLLKGVAINATGATSGMMPGGGGISRAMGGGGGGMFQVGPGSDSAAGDAGAGGLGGHPFNPGVLTSYGATTDAGYALIHVIQEGTAPGPWMNTDGDGGTITEFNGLITVRHSQQMHDKIADLLEKLRKASTAKE